jgi:glycosyltransferase involved in cell wall biosynthesis
MKKVLIAHQSTIPHYRIPFYNALEQLRPESWEFKVVFDPSEVKNKKFFKEGIDINEFHFPILKTETYSINISTKKISYQPFLPFASKSDLVIVENALNNISYPISHLYQLRGVKIAYWGIGRDMNVIKPTLPKLISEKIKMTLVGKADGFFAYTCGVKDFLVKNGISPRNIFVLNNTIDIKSQRTFYDRYLPEKDVIKERLGLRGYKVLLFVGRLTKDKKVDFLLESFSILEKQDKDFRLIVIGSGDESYFDDCSERVIYLGSITDLDKLGPIYVASDVFVFPSGVGLGPLQAFCYSLPLVTIRTPLAGPEVEYLNPSNSIILPESTTPDKFAEKISSLFSDNSTLEQLKASTWPSINHLTIEQMARNFIQGINEVLGIDKTAN